jgi:hypothetical protein
MAMDRRVRDVQFSPAATALLAGLSGEAASDADMEPGPRRPAVFAVDARPSCGAAPCGFRQSGTSASFVATKLDSIGEAASNSDNPTGGTP